MVGPGRFQLDLHVHVPLITAATDAAGHSKHTRKQQPLASTCSCKCRTSNVCSPCSHAPMLPPPASFHALPGRSARRTLSSARARAPARVASRACAQTRRRPRSSAAALHSSPPPSFCDASTSSRCIHRPLCATLERSAVRAPGSARACAQTRRVPVLPLPRSTAPPLPASAMLPPSADASTDQPAAGGTRARAPNSHPSHATSTHRRARPADSFSLQGSSESWRCFHSFSREPRCCASRRVAAECRSSAACPISLYVPFGSDPA